MPNNKCSYGYLHKCKVCAKPNCKRIFHLNSQQSGSHTCNRNFHNSPNKQESQVNVNCVETSNDTTSLLSAVNQVSDGVKSLTTRMEQVEKRFPQPQAAQPSSATTQDPRFGMPAITALPSNSSVSDLDLANKIILWTKVTSAGVSLPLPLDSCCSVSLVSQKHAETVAKQHPHLKFSKLEQHLPVSVAGPNSNLKAVGILQVPIVWENGKSVTFTMLVVPNLTWPILFGQNHLRKTDARIRSRELKVYFADPALDFEISCYDSNPLAAFPALRNPDSSPGSSANVTCLLTAMKTSSFASDTHVSLARGFNLVTVCLVLTASLLGSPLLSGPLWLEGTQFSPGLQTLSGPIDLTCVKTMSQPGETPPSFLPASHPCYPKCHPSRPIPPVDKHCAGILGSQSSDVHAFDDPHNQVFITSVVIRSTKGSAKLPFNVSLGSLRPITEADTATLSEAASHTAQVLSDSWYSFVTSGNPITGAEISSDIKPESSVNDHCFLSANASQSIHSPLESNDANGLGSSLLSPYLEGNDFDHEHAFPPSENKGIDPNSAQFFEQLVKALELDTPMYAHVSSDVMAKFKQLIRKYSHAFHLPNSPLTAIKGFYHNINTGDAPPVYKLPYRKSPAELCAIKEELQRMLRLNIIRPSHSPWGAPCILVRKPLEKGKPQPPRFVVDYRGLNAVTQGDGYPIPNVSNVLDAISGGKIFAKLDLASGYWQVPVNPKHREKTAFATHLGLWDFSRMPFGLKTAPQTFQRILNTVFADFLYQWLIIYIDDCITWSNSYEEALVHYEKLLQRAVKVGIQFKPSKCQFFSSNLKILGHRVTPEGRFPTEKGTEAISSFERPHNVSSLKRFLGMVGYFRDYIPDMSRRSQNLRSLLSQKASFSWTHAHEAEFQDLKTALLSPDTILFHPDWDKEFEVHTDASKVGCGAMLAQRHNGILRPVRFASRAFSATESRWPTFHHEFFAVKWALEHFRPYLLGRKFKVITDHANLKFLASVAPQNSKMARWCLSLAEFDFTIEHSPGKENVVPDALSRAPLPMPHPEVNTLVIPPPEVCCFYQTAPWFDIPLSHADNGSEPLDFSLSCLNVACSLSLPSTAHKVSHDKPVLVPTPRPADLCAIAASDDTFLTENLPKVRQWPEDLAKLQPLNLDRAQFAQKQRQDPWLGPFARFLIAENSPQAISECSHRVKKWVQNSLMVCCFIPTNL